MRFMTLAAILPVLAAGTVYGQTNSEAPRPIRLGGVKAGIPSHKPGLNVERMSLPFTRMGPTARTIGQGPQPGQPEFTRPLLTRPQLSKPRFAPLDIRPGRPGTGSISDTPSTPGHSGVQGPSFDGRWMGAGHRRGRAHGHHDRHGHGDHGRHGLHSGVITTGSGLSIGGSFDDGNFRVRFDTGSPIDFHCPKPPHHGHVIFPPLGYPYPLGYTFYRPYHTVYGSYAAYDPALYSQPLPAPAPAPAAAPAPADQKELGALLLFAGEYSDAAQAFKAFLAINPSDSGATRGLGLAMVGAGNTKDGVSLISMAYRNDPALAGEPLPADVFGSEKRLRRMVERISIYANRVQTPSAWLSLAVLMQAQGRDALAHRMVERGMRVGLEQEVAAQMTAALKP